MDVLKVKKSHLMKVIEELKTQGEGNYAHVLENLFDIDHVEDRGVLEFNGDHTCDVSFVDEVGILTLNKVPYAYFCDGDAEFDDFWEYYNPAVSEDSKVVSCSKADDEYILKEWRVKEWSDLPAEEFKQKVMNYFINPFSEYPELSELED